MKVSFVLEGLLNKKDRLWGNKGLKVETSREIYEITNREKQKNWKKKEGGEVRAGWRLDTVASNSTAWTGSLSN